MNWKDKSTVGWSIENVLLDFSGGMLSMLQQVLSAYNTDDWTFVTENVPKLIIGMESMVICIIFIIQHYALYKGNESLSRSPRSQSAETSSHPKGTSSDGLQVDTDGKATHVVQMTDGVETADTLQNQLESSCKSTHSSTGSGNTNSNITSTPGSQPSEDPTRESVSSDDCDGTMTVSV